MKRRIFSIFLSLALISSLVPAPALATDNPGLCEHHAQHDESCGYTEGTEGTSCAHEHTDDCYLYVTKCVHEHTAECYSDGVLPAEGENKEADACAHAHTEECCVPGAGCIHVHTAECYSDGIVPAEGEEKTADACAHECSRDNGCITDIKTNILDCKHVHDESCGYTPATEGTSCQYECKICDVQGLIDALPALSEMENMNDDEREEAIVQYTEAYEAYEALSDEEKAQINGADDLLTFADMMSDATPLAIYEFADNTLAGQTYYVDCSEDTVIDLTGVTDNTTSSQSATIRIKALSENLNVEVKGNADHLYHVTLMFSSEYGYLPTNIKLNNFRTDRGISFSFASTESTVQVEYTGILEANQIQGYANNVNSVLSLTAANADAMLKTGYLKSESSLSINGNGGKIEILSGVNGDRISAKNKIEIKNCTLSMEHNRLGRGILAKHILIEKSTITDVSTIQTFVGGWGDAYNLTDIASMDSSSITIKDSNLALDYAASNFQSSWYYDCMLGRARYILIDNSTVTFNAKGYSTSPGSYTVLGGVFDTLTIQNGSKVTAHVGDATRSVIGVNLEDMRDRRNYITAEKDLFQYKIVIDNSKVYASGKDAAAIGLGYRQTIYGYTKEAYAPDMTIEIKGDNTIVEATSFSAAAIGASSWGTPVKDDGKIELEIGAGNIGSWGSGTTTDGTASMARSMLRSPRNGVSAADIEAQIAEAAELLDGVTISITGNPTIRAMSGVLAVYGDTVTSDTTNLVQNTMVQQSGSSYTLYAAENPGSVTIGSATLGNLGYGYASVASTKVDTQSSASMYFGSSRLTDVTTGSAEFNVNASGWQPFFTTPALEIYGTVQLMNNSTNESATGSAAVGTELKADISALLPASVRSGSNKATYQWYRDGVEISGKTSNTYTLAVEDEGHVIYCVVSGVEANGYTGSVTSNAITVTSTEGTSVSIPEMDSRTETSITLKNAGNGYRYKIINGPKGNEDWQDSTEFTGLTKGQTYTFIQKDGSDNISPAANFSTLSDAPLASEFTFDYVAERMTFPNDVVIYDNIECTGTPINQNSGGLSVDISNYISNSGDEPQKLYAKYTDADASNVTEITVPNRPAMTPLLKADVLVTSDSISFAGAEGVSYQLQNSTGEMVGTQQLGDGSTITFDGLTAGQTYTLKMRVEASNTPPGHFHSDQYDLKLPLSKASTMTGTILVPANTEGARSYDLSRWLGTTAITGVTETEDTDSIINDASSSYEGTVLTLTAASIAADKTATLTVNAGNSKTLTLTVQTVTVLAEEDDGVLWVRPFYPAADYIDGGKTAAELSDALDSAAQADGYSAEGKESFILRPLNAVGGDLAASRGDVKISFTPTSATDLAGKVIAIYMIPKAGGEPQKIPAERNAEGGVDFTLSGQGGYLCFYYKDGQTAEISINKITVNDGTADASTAVYQDQVSVQVSVAAGTGSTAGTPTGTVTLYNGKPGTEGAAILATGDLKNGEAVLSFTVAGEHVAAQTLNLYAVYAGDNNYVPVSTEQEKQLTVDPATLAKPGNLSWDGKDASWGGVTNADNYTVMLYKKGENGNNDSLVKNGTTSNTEYDFASDITEAGIYYVKVVANGSGNYATSNAATSSEVTYYTVSVGTATGGSATASSTYALAGATITLKPSANTGYVFWKWDKDSNNTNLEINKDETTGEWEFTMPPKNVTVTPVFEQNPAAPEVTAVTADSKGYEFGTWTTQESVTITVSGGNTDSGIARYEYSTDNGKTWETLAADNTTENGTLTIDTDTNTTYLFRTVTKAGAVGESVSKTVKIDSTAPGATINVNDDMWNGFLNTITFGKFFKETTKVNITGSDDGSGVASVEYRLSSTALTDSQLTSSDDWTSFEVGGDGKYSFNIEPNNKGSVYVRVKDNAGNTTVINSAGIVVYTDAEQKDTAITFTRLQTVDVSFHVTLNGNTVKSITLCNQGETTGTEINSDNYKVGTDGKITLDADWLQTLAAGSYTLRVDYNPMGEEYVAANGNEEPTSTTVTLTVSKADQTELTITGVPETVYSGDSFTLSVEGGSGDGAITWEVVSGSATVDGDGKVAVTGTGDVEIKVTKAASADYGAMEQTITFTVVSRPSGGGGPSTYPPTVADSEGGDVSVSPSRPTSGQTVTIKPNPDEGYEVEDVTVTDSRGNEVAVTDNGDGTYSFRQPSGRVTIEVTFRGTGAAADCPRDDTCPLAKFTDLDRNAWYHDGIQYCLKHGLMNGTSASTFAPDVTTSRAMIAVILWRQAGSPIVEEFTDFSDVADGAWYTQAVRWASNAGVVGGYPNGSFGPSDPITREQLAAMLYRYAQYQGMETATLEENLAEFNDSNRISSYAVQAMNWAVGQGIMGGYGNGILGPQGQATRAQAAAMLQRFCERISEA